MIQTPSPTLLPASPVLPPTPPALPPSPLVLLPQSSVVPVTTQGNLSTTTDQTNSKCLMQQ